MKYIPHFEPEFLPMELFLRGYEEEVAACKDKTKVILVAVRGKENHRYEFFAFPDGCGKDDMNFRVAERMAKALLWVIGGAKILVSGSKEIAKRLKEAYAKDGIRAFDEDFMSTVYRAPFEVEYVEIDQLPPVKKASMKIGGNLKGCRIGFDAGGSDRKVSAVVDGEVVYEEEVVWSPKLHEDLEYHFDGILSAFKSAASHMERVDGIGVSTAGVVIEDRPMVSSLFLKADKKKYGQAVFDIYLDAAKALGKDIPISVANDGDVTALAGAMSLKQNKVLGIAMGTSEAGGYINAEGGLNGWISELAFAPVDANPGAMEDEWSHDRGVGCKYFSQDAVIKLGDRAGIAFPEGSSPAEKLSFVQALMEKDDPIAAGIYSDIGIYLGYTIPFYSRFYEIDHLLLLGRVMSGKGGDIIMAKAKEVLEGEFPEFAHVHMFTPDEKLRRVGQAIAAASLPAER